MVSATSSTRPGPHQSLADLVKAAYSLRPHSGVSYESLLHFVMHTCSPAYAIMSEQIGTQYMRDMERRIELLDADSYSEPGLFARLVTKQLCFPITRKQYAMRVPMDEGPQGAEETPSVSAGWESPKLTMQRVSHFLEKKRPRMERYLKGSVRLPLWDPSAHYCSDAAKHLQSLRIPDLGDGPDLLLHELGEWATKVEIAARLDKAFVPGQNTLLCNGAGSGKTRLLLEGLCEHWGFYLTADRDDCRGSRDLSNIFRDTAQATVDLRNKYPAMDPQDDAFKAARANLNTATERRLRQVSFARMVIMAFFMGLVLQTSPRSTAEARYLWTVLQVSPSTIIGSDIFDELADVVGNANDEMLDTARVFAKWIQVRITRANPNAGFFCVIDAAQHAATQSGTLAIQDYDRKSKSKSSILCDLVRVWSAAGNSLLTFMVSGSSQAIKVVDNPANASGGAERWAFRTDTGEFYARHVPHYVYRYITLAGFEAPARFEFSSRLHWLRGRYMFAASFIMALLKYGYDSPNRFLTAFLKKHMGTAAGLGLQKYEDKEPQLSTCAESYVSSFSTFDFGQFALYPYAFATLKRISADVSRYGTFPSSDDNAKALLEAGFARFTDDGDEIKVDEPMVAVATAVWFNNHPKIAELASGLRLGPVYVTGDRCESPSKSVLDLDVSRL